MLLRHAPGLICINAGAGEGRIANQS